MFKVKVSLAKLNRKLEDGSIPGRWSELDPRLRDLIRNRLQMDLAKKSSASYKPDELAGMTRSLRDFLQIVNTADAVLAHHRVALDYMKEQYPEIEEIFPLYRRTKFSSFPKFKDTVEKTISEAVARRGASLDSTTKVIEGFLKGQTVRDFAHTIDEVYGYERSRILTDGLNDWLEDPEALRLAMESPVCDLTRELLRLRQADLQGKRVQDLELHLFKAVLDLEDHSDLLKRVLGCDSAVDCLRSAVERDGASPLEVAKIKNLIKFTSLENDRHQKELVFIRRLLVKLSDKKGTLKRMSRSGYVQEMLYPGKVASLLRETDRCQSQLERAQSRLKDIMANFGAGDDDSFSSIQELLQILSLKAVHVNLLRKKSFAYIFYDEAKSALSSSTGSIHSGAK